MITSRIFLLILWCDVTVTSIIVSSENICWCFICCRYLLMLYNSNLHMAVARMDIAATDNGDGKPLTNGVAKEEVRI